MLNNTIENKDLFDDNVYESTENNTAYDHWIDMPEYNNINEPEAEITATFKFRNINDYEEFKEKAKKYIYDGDKLFDGSQTKTKKQAWYPLKEKASKYIRCNFY